MSYIDGFVLACREDQKEAFIEHARQFDPIFIEFGALRVVECWEDDVPEGEVTSFPMAVKREPGEAVLFSFIEWPSKEVREASMIRMMDDPRFDPTDVQMPFDGKRMIFGGFTPVLECKAGDDA